MISAEQNKRMTRVGPGTPAGKLLRRYWQPVALLEAASQARAQHRQKVERLLKDLSPKVKR
jgi:hypothetical protein